MTIWRLHPLLRKPGTSFPDPSAMFSSRRSPIALSPGFTPGVYDTNLVTAGLGMLEIGARQLNDWRPHEPPDSLPFCQPGVPFNTPILLLAATSSIPTTWAVQEVTHVLLGRPWQFDRKVFHDGFTNKLSFEFHGHKVILKSLSPREVHEDQNLRRLFLSLAMLSTR